MEEFSLALGDFLSLGALQRFYVGNFIRNVFYKSIIVVDTYTVAYLSIVSFKYYNKFL